MEENLELKLTAERLDPSEPITLDSINCADIIYSTWGKYYKVESEVSIGRYENHESVLKKRNDFANYLRGHNQDLTSIKVTYSIPLGDPQKELALDASNSEKDQGDDDNLPF